MARNEWKNNLDGIIFIGNGAWYRASATPAYDLISADHMRKAHAGLSKINRDDEKARTAYINAEFPGYREYRSDDLGLWERVLESHSTIYNSYDFTDDLRTFAGVDSDRHPAIMDALTLLAGKPYEYKIIEGKSSLLDDEFVWQGCYYPTDTDEEALDQMAAEYFNDKDMLA